MELKIAVNIFYSPTEHLKKILQDNKDIYIPINGGSSLSSDNWARENLIFDNIGDNISEKNEILNEMTSLYWIWKHYNEIGNPEYIGHNHYRRFFKRTDLEDYKNYNLIISKPIFSSNTYSLAWQYKHYHVIDDLQLCVNQIREFDKEFGNSFVDYLNTTGTNYAPCNMFVMTQNLFFVWCQFIFPILFALENKIELKGRDNYQKRALCFLTERIFNFWCYRLKNDGYKIKEVEMVEFLDFKPPKINERGDFE